MRDEEHLDAGLGASHRWQWRSSLRRRAAPLVPSLGITALCLLLIWPAPMAEAGSPTTPRSSIHIPQIEGAPSLEDFASMQPSTPLVRSMARVDGFR